MKRILSTAVLSLLFAMTFAQIPQTFSYQAVVRDSYNNIVADQPLTVFVYILRGSDDGAEVYSENHVVKTNPNGLMTFELGGGLSSKTFSSIDWSKGPYFVKTVINIDGLPISGVTPLLAVPYALYAVKAGNSDIDLSDYAKKSDIPEFVDLSDYAKTSDLNNINSSISQIYYALDDYVKSTDIDAIYAKESDLSNYYSKTQVDALLENFLMKFGIDDGSIHAKFSVSDNKQVYFSQGNLQYRASTNSWRFAENQWDIIGEDNKNISSSYSGWIDLFGYGTSGFNGKRPYTTSTNQNAYSTSNIAGTKYDWGVYNVFNNAIGHWRTLTKQEWTYLLNRNSEQLYSIGTVNGVYGLILLPDEWKDQPSVNFTPQADDWDINNYSQEEWELMQSNGSVFLPVAGYRIGTEFEFYSDDSFRYYHGEYWCAELVNNRPYTFHFTKKSKYSNKIAFGVSDFHRGESVRLVRDAD